MAKHTPLDEQRRLVALWQTTDLPMAAFARNHGILPMTFGSWAARHGDPPPAEESRAPWRADGRSPPQAHASLTRGAPPDIDREDPLGQLGAGEFVAASDSWGSDRDA